MTALPPGRALAEALYGITRLGAAHPATTFRTTRASAATIRNQGNAYLADIGAVGVRMAVYRTRPNIGQTHTATEWEARLVRAEKETA